MLTFGISYWDTTKLYCTTTLQKYKTQVKFYRNYIKLTFMLWKQHSLNPLNKSTRLLAFTRMTNAKTCSPLNNQICISYLMVAKRRCAAHHVHKVKYWFAINFLFTLFWSIWQWIHYTLFEIPWKWWQVDFLCVDFIAYLNCFALITTVCEIFRFVN